MKKIVTLLVATAALVGIAEAQNVKIVREATSKTVSESSVPVNKVRDFQNQNIDAHNVEWTRIDSLTYEVNFLDAAGDPQGIRYSAYGTERRYYIAEDFYPRAVRDTVAKHYKGYSITQVCVSEIRRKTTYEVRIAKHSGFLFWKKEKDVAFLNFDINGKFIDKN